MITAQDLTKNTWDQISIERQFYWVVCHCIPYLLHRKAETDRIYPEQRERYHGVGELDHLPNETFQVAVVAGWEAGQCIKTALRLLVPRGFLLVNHFWTHPKLRDLIPEILVACELICDGPTIKFQGELRNLTVLQKK
jgi:hypothetical protein